MADQVRRRIERHLAEARLPAGKTLATFDFESVPMVSKAQVMALASGDAWLAKGANILLFGPPGGGKSHLSAALGLALVENGRRVMFARTTDLVQRLQVARRELTLENMIAKLDRYDLLILDDIAYVTKDQAETSVLFELIAARYERRSMLITANQPFGEWGKIFPDQAMTLAAIDRLIHHATILEMNVESYRRREALERKRRRGRPPAHATITRNREARKLIDADRQSKRACQNVGHVNYRVSSAAASHPRLSRQFSPSLSRYTFHGHRFRHGTRFLRWRPDKAPRQCTFEQLTQRRANLASLLA